MNPNERPQQRILPLKYLNARCVDDFEMNQLDQSTAHLLRQRELCAGNVFKNYQDWRSLIDRIGLEKVLEGHDGCVNTLRWNRSGTLLLSGSDDQTVKIWNLAGELVKSIATTHTGNVFGAEFLPHSGDQILVTSAADCSVRLHYLEYKEEPYVWKARQRVKRLAVANDEPYLVWSAAEDGHIRQHDTRTYEAPTILRHEQGFKSLAVCAERTEFLAVAPTSEIVPVYDRRYMSKPMIEVQPGDFDAESDDSHYPTHVGFDDLGTELLVNMGGRAVYVFDIRNPQEKPESTWDAVEKVVANPTGPHEDLKGSADLLACTRRLNKMIEEKRVFEGIDAYTTEIHSGRYSESDQSILLAERGFSRLTRHGDGDAYAALKDALEAMKISCQNRKAIFCLARALVNLKQWKLASQACRLYRVSFPQSNTIRRVEDKLRGIEDSFSAENRDYKERYIGQHNNFTDIKEAAFFGGNQGYILAGSDCGSLFVWDRKAGVLHSLFNADADILNIVQPHPTLPIFATSGIEDVIRLWGPMPAEEYRCQEKYENPYEALKSIHGPGASDASILQGHQFLRMFHMNEAPIECTMQ
ncbi:unnamed protein product, partial [Mesorhabditis belari]|uniref:WD and tetratricopeptide repeats protein 1 n=1 Tax=Mesorhabditis belari TaxID=2138241 RepID=A0AAF3ESU9_9BILA